MKRKCNNFLFKQRCRQQHKGSDSLDVRINVSKNRTKINYLTPIGPKQNCSFFFFTAENVK